MERRSHRQFFGLTLALLAAEVRADEFELPAWSQILKASKRFQLVMGGAAVLDKETGLVWEKSPGDTNNTGDVTAADQVTWFVALLRCQEKNVGGRKGWRLASIEELASLIDPSQSNPALPMGHPFTNVQSADYWSATTVANGPTDAFTVNFGDGDSSDSFSKSSTGDASFVWCVRGNGPLAVY